MSCAHAYAFAAGLEQAFEVDSTRVRYGSGVLGDVGYDAAALGMKRAALFVDPVLRALPAYETVHASLVAAGIDVATFAEIHVEPTDASFKRAAAFAADGRFDGYVSLGGGSTIDTAKAANLYATFPAAFETYVNAPVGEGRPVPGPLRPHIACPTTCGTGSEVTGIAIFDDLDRRLKTGIASRRLRPTLGIVDPDVTRTLPPMVVACSGFDVLNHALESYTALPFSRRPAPADPGGRPMSQGANPYSDMACLEALRILGANIVRAVRDAGDFEARERLMYAATLAGIGFGNAGVHVPHAMSYAVAGLVRDFRAADYPAGEPIVPHGMAVIVNTPAVVRWTALADPERHLRAAELLGADVAAVDPSDAGDALAERITALMQATGMPNGVGGAGFAADDIARLRDGAARQRRLLGNAPRETGRSELEALFSAALRYW